MKEKKFLTFNRREFIKLAVFGAAAGTAFGVKRTVFDPVPVFAVDNVEAAADPGETIVDLTGNFVWDDSYDLAFVRKYIGYGRSIDKRFNSDLFSDMYAHPLPSEKYLLTKQKVLNEQILRAGDFSKTAPASMKDLAAVHSKSHIVKLYVVSYCLPFSIVLRGESPLMPELVPYVRKAAGGTYAAARIALEKGIAMNFAGGFHHSFADRETAFCYINDVAMAIKKLRIEKRIKKVMIIDMDVHHGDGNAKITLNDPTVVIYDVYQEDNFPRKKYPVAYAVAMTRYNNGRGVTDDIYLNAIKTLPEAVDREAPDLVVYLAGADLHEKDVLGGFSLTTSGLMKRDAFVINTIRSLNIPVAIVPAGGYPEDINDVVDIHTNTATIVKQHC